MRARFSALDRPLAFLDAPGGTQCPDEVIDAISAYLREDNANIGAPYETSIRTEELIERARAAAGRWLGCHPDEVAFGPSMTSLNFLLTRAFGRTLATGDEILVTKLDHDANVAPWLELEHDLGVVVRFVEVNDDLTLDLADLERQLSDRTRVVAFPIASNAVGTMPDVARDRRAGALGGCARLGRRGPLRAARPDRRRGVGRRRPSLLAVQVLRAASRARLRRRRAARLVAAVQGAPGVERAGREPLPARHAAARAARGLRRRGRVRGVAGLGGDRGRTRRELGRRFLAGLPEPVELYGLRTTSGRVPTFCFNLPGRAAADVATELAARQIAVWHGDYYAVEVMKRLGLGEAGAVRAGFVHYNTAEEVDRLLAALAELC